MSERVRHPAPAFELLFACDGQIDVAKFFVVDEPESNGDHARRQMLANVKSNRNTNGKHKILRLRFPSLKKTRWTLLRSG